MAMYPYIEGSARVANVDGAEYGLGIGLDYETISEFIAARVSGQDLSVNPPTLIIPAGATHEEEIGGALAITGGSGASATKRVLIVGEDPTNPPSVHLISPGGAAVKGGFDVSEPYSEMWDFKLSLTYTGVVGAGEFAIAAHCNATNKFIGLVLENLIGESVAANGYLAGFSGWNSAVMIECAVNALKTINAASGIPIAFFGLAGNNKFYNCVSASTGFATGAAFAGGITDEMINCIAQNAWGNVSGGIVETTSRVGQNITMSADGYHVPNNDEVAAGSITDVSAIFTDDIDGQEIVSAIVGADYVPAAPANTAPTVDQIMPMDGSTTASITSRVLQGVYHDADGDVGSLIFKDGDGNTIGTAAGLAADTPGETTWTGLIPGNSYTFTVTPNDGTEDGTPVESTFTINAGPTVDQISPADGASVACTDTLALAARFNDADGGSGSLIFALADGTVIGTASDVDDGATGGVNWTGLSAGDQVFKVRAYDGADYSAWSDLVTVTISAGSSMVRRSSRVGPGLSRRVGADLSSTINTEVISG